MKTNTTAEGQVPTWEVKTFDQLTKDELLAIFKERIDDFDKKAIHIFQQNQDGKPIAYCRLIPTDKTVKLGRVFY